MEILDSELAWMKVVVKDKEWRTSKFKIFPIYKTSLC